MFQMYGILLTLFLCGQFVYSLDEKENKWIAPLVSLALWVAFLFSIN